MRSKIARIITDDSVGVFWRGLLLALVLGIASCGSGPPVQEMSDARQAIAVAEEAGAATSAADELRDAQALLDSAEEKLKRRAYRGAREDALQAKTKALEALAASENTVTDHDR